MKCGVRRPASGFRVGGAGLRVGTAIGGVLLIAACAQMPSAQGLGRLGQAALPIGPEKEREIGFGIAATVAGRYDVVDDAARNFWASPYSRCRWRRA